MLLFCQIIEVLPTTVNNTVEFCACNYLVSTSSFAIKKSRCDFDDKLKVGDVRYKHLTQITIKVQLF